MAEAFTTGLFTALGLIVAIGAQNAFVLRQGLRREHVGAVVLICAGSDVVLIILGVGGFSAIERLAPWAGQLMLWAGAAFLLVYGALRFRAAAQGCAVQGGAVQGGAAQGGAALAAGERPNQTSGTIADNAMPLRRVLLTCVILTWANPHVWLDTVALLGSVAAQYQDRAFVFAFGACLASISFFSALGYGARWLSPVFARPRAWVWLELAMGCIMWAIAASLLLRG